MSQISGIDLAVIHNATHTLVQAYGQLLTEQDRRIQVLLAQLKVAQEENAKIRKALEAALAQPSSGSER